jgi:hypothetical protein
MKRAVVLTHEWIVPVLAVLAGTVACGNGSGGQSGNESDAASSGSSGSDAGDARSSSGSSGNDAADATSSGSSGSATADADSSSQLGGDADATFSGANGGDADADGAVGSDADAGPSSATMGPFLGSWSCPYTTDSGYMDSTPFVFTQNPDGTLSSTSMIEIDACTLQWTVSGSTATAIAGEQCGGFTVNSYTFKLEEGPEQGIAFAIATAIEHGTNVEPDGGTSPVDIAGSFAGFCTKDGTGDGGTPTLCEEDPVVGCGAGSVGYLCLGTYSPQALNSSISCPELFIGGSSCCAMAPSGDP